MSPISPTDARFPGAKPGAGMYESYYLRLLSPDEPVGVWIRNTIHKRPGCEPVGTVWFTFFDRAAGRPLARKQELAGPASPPGKWIRIGRSSIGPGGIEGECAEASWSLKAEPHAPALYHLPHDLLYRLPLPKTKPISPMPDATFDGELRIGERVIEVDGWRGMIGHNWGAEHAERWIWMAGTGFAEDPDAWIDVVLGRIRVAGRLLPWVANGAFSLGGDGPVRLGGMFARGLGVDEKARHLEAQLPVAGGGSVSVVIDSPENATVGWRYADPTPLDAPPREHDVANCSIATLTLTRDQPNRPPLTLTTGHGGAYELGMTERDHGVAIEPGTEGGTTLG